MPRRKATPATTDPGTEYVRAAEVIVGMPRKSMAAAGRLYLTRDLLITNQLLYQLSNAGGLRHGTFTNIFGSIL